MNSKKTQSEDIAFFLASRGFGKEEEIMNALDFYFMTESQRPRVTRGDVLSLALCHMWIIAADEADRLIRECACSSNEHALNEIEERLVQNVRSGVIIPLDVINPHRPLSDYYGDFEVTRRTIAGDSGTEDVWDDMERFVGYSIEQAIELAKYAVSNGLNPNTHICVCAYGPSYDSEFVVVYIPDGKRVKAITRFSEEETETARNYNYWPKCNDDEQTPTLC